MFSKKAFWWLFVGILLAAAVIRLYRLGSVPVSLYWDEAAMYVDVKSVITTGLDMHGRPWFQVIYPSYGDFKLPVLIWFSSFTSLVFGLSEWSVRLPSALAGIGTVVVASLIARELLDGEEEQKKMLQLLTMAVMAFSPWSVVFSRTAFEGHIGQFFLALSVWCALFSQKKSWTLYFASVFGAIATYCYFSVRFVWVGVFVAVMLLMLTKNVQKFEWKKMAGNAAQKILLPLIIFFILLLPMLRSPLYEDTNKFRLGTDSVLKNEQQVLQSNVYREMAGNSRVDRVLFHRWWLTTQELMKNYSDNLSLNFLFVTGDPNLRHGTQNHGLFLLILLPAFLCGVFCLFRDQKRVLAVLFVWWMLALLPASVPQNTPHALRSLNALVPLAIIIGWGILRIFEIKNSQLRSFTFFSLLTVYFFSTFSFLYFYFSVYPKLSANDWQSGYQPLAHEITRTTTKTYVLHFDDRFYLWLMGYGPYSGKDFQSWKSENYQFAKAIPNVVFGEPDQKQISEAGHFQIAGQKQRVEEVIQRYHLTPTQLHEVSDETGVQKFMVAEFGR